MYTRADIYCTGHWNGFSLAYICMYTVMSIHLLYWTLEWFHIHMYVYVYTDVAILATGMVSVSFQAYTRHYQCLFSGINYYQSSNFPYTLTVLYCGITGNCPDHARSRHYADSFFDSAVDDRLRFTGVLPVSHQRQPAGPMQGCGG